MACETGGWGGALLRLWIRRSDAPKFARTRVATKHLLTYINLDNFGRIRAVWVGRLSHLRTIL